MASKREFTARQCGMHFQKPRRSISRLVDQAGLKTELGGPSEIHGNFIVNEGGPHEDVILCQYRVPN